MTYKEKKDKIAELFSNYTAIKDKDINAIAEAYPLTAQAIYDVQKAAPEARIKVIAVTISKEILDSVGDNINAAFVAIRSEVNKRFINELTNLMMGQRAFGNIAQANHIISMTNNAFSNLVTALHQSAVCNVIRNELTYALNEIITESGDKVVCPELCVAAIIKDTTRDSEEKPWYTHFTDYTVATQLYDALQRMTHYDFKLAKRNAGIEWLYSDLEAGEVISRDDKIPQGLFDNPDITIDKLRTYLNGMTNHFDAVVLADNLGFDPNNFTDKVTKQLSDGDYADFADRDCVPDINMMLINDTPAIVVRYGVYNCESLMESNQVALVLNCNHPEIVEYMEALYKIDDLAEENAAAKYKSRHNGEDPEYRIAHDSIVWEFMGTHDCYGNVYAFDLDMIEEYTEYLSNDIVTRTENYNKTGNPFHSVNVHDDGDKDDK
mgnify:FL=1